LSAKEISERFEKVGLPYAPITRPHELFDDPHLLATGGLAPVTIAADNTSTAKDIETRAALLPLALNGERLRIRHAPPRIGADTVTLLESLGYTTDEIDRLRDQGIIRSVEPNSQ
jgi:crotonobetainyl-CoA:carnitine CoA-transferase CaiB-like acyl-CoA transferase